MIGQQGLSLDGATGWDLESQAAEVSLGWGLLFMYFVMTTIRLSAVVSLFSSVYFALRVVDAASSKRTGSILGLTFAIAMIGSLLAVPVATQVGSPMMFTSAASLAALLASWNYHGKTIGGK